jgi:hypothetical protein
MPGSSLYLKCYHLSLTTILGLRTQRNIYAGKWQLRRHARPEQITLHGGSSSKVVSIYVIVASIYIANSDASPFLLTLYVDPWSLLSRIASKDVLTDVVPPQSFQLASFLHLKHKVGVKTEYEDGGAIHKYGMNFGIHIPRGRPRRAAYEIIFKHRNLHRCIKHFHTYT